MVCVDPGSGDACTVVPAAKATSVDVVCETEEDVPEVVVGGALRVKRFCSLLSAKAAACLGLGTGRIWKLAV